MVGQLVKIYLRSYVSVDRFPVYSGATKSRLNRDVKACWADRARGQCVANGCSAVLLEMSAPRGGKWKIRAAVHLVSLFIKCVNSKFTQINYMLGKFIC